MSKRRHTSRFRSKSRGRSRLADWWLVWRMPVLLLIVMAAWWFGFRPSADEREWVEVTAPFALCGESRAGESRGGQRAAGCVVDGDTVVIGFGASRRRIRLTGFDTPELSGACAAESELAQTARLRLHEWLNQGAFEWSGADDPPYDQYGRELREVRRSSEYLAETMIDAGLAAQSGWGGQDRDWCA